MNVRNTTNKSSSLSLFPFAELNTISQILFFQDESLEVQYKDHSVLQLSPCGANFKYSFCKGQGVMKQNGTIMKRCEYATSESRRKVVECLLIRNSLATDPNLPFEFLCKYGNINFVEMEKNITMDSWESCNLTPTVTYGDDGSVVIESLKGWASLKLFPNQHKVKATYLLNIDETKRRHVWIDKYFSAKCCPPSWKFALTVAENILSKNNKKVKNLPMNTEFPKCLPNLCPKQFTHQWREVVDYNITFRDERLEFNESNINEELVLPVQQNNLKVQYVWRDDVSYWIYRDNGKHEGGFFVEAWLADNSILISVDNSDVYYKHWFMQENNDPPFKYTETIVSPAALVSPCNSKLKTILLRCNRLKSYCVGYKTELISTCWNCKSDHLLHILNMEASLSETICDKGNMKTMLSKDGTLARNKVDGNFDTLKINTNNIRKALQGTQSAISKIDEIILQTKNTLNSKNKYDKISNLH